MLYNVLFEYKHNEAKKRQFISVTKNLEVETGMLPPSLLGQLVVELAKLAKDQNYQRVNPYRFEAELDRHVYIEYAEPTKRGYEVIQKRIMHISNKDNFKIPPNTFLFDLLDYFVFLGYLDSEYKFIAHDTLYELVPVKKIYSKNQLIEEGFVFPPSPYNHYE